MPIAASFTILSLPLPLPTLACGWRSSCFIGLLFASLLSLPSHPDFVAFLVGVPKRFFLKMSLTLPPPLGVSFTSFFGLGDSPPGVVIPGVSLPFLFCGLGVTLPVFTSGVAALLAGLLGTIFLSGISIEK
jgi:hypothetical protein